MTLIRFLLFLFLVSTVIHFGWGISQMSLYAFSGVTITGYADFVRMHWIAALKGGGMTVGVYMLVALFLRNASWGKKFTNQRIIYLAVFGFLWALGVEYNAVVVGSRWAYSSAMPILPGIKVGLSPLLQMVAVPLLSIFLVRKQLSEK